MSISLYTSLRVSEHNETALFTYVVVREVLFAGGRQCCELEKRNLKSESRSIRVTFLEQAQNITLSLKVCFKLRIFHYSNYETLVLYATY